MAKTVWYRQNVSKIVFLHINVLKWLRVQYKIIKYTVNYLSHTHNTPDGAVRCLFNLIPIFLNFRIKKRLNRRRRKKSTTLFESHDITCKIRLWNGVPLSSLFSIPYFLFEKNQKFNERSHQRSYSDNDNKWKWRIFFVFNRGLNR